MTYEVWLQPNRRAIWFGSILPLVIAIAGMLLIGLGIQSNSFALVAGVALVVVAVAALAALIHLAARPPISYCDGHVLFNLRGGAPIPVPVNIVEAFFMGQAPANLAGDSHGREKTTTLVARLAQRHTEWAQRDVKPTFGNWREGYVTVRGTWCEPLNAEVVRRINRRLKEVKALTDQSTPDVSTDS